MLSIMRNVGNEISTIIKGGYKSFIEPFFLALPTFFAYFFAQFRWYTSGMFSFFGRTDDNMKLKSVGKAEKPDVIFIGAGPTGLWTAIQLKLHSPNLNILMFEKYSEYTRNRNVFVEASSFSNSHPNLRFQEVIAEFPGKVTLNNMEDKLLAFAKTLGIEIRNEEIQQCENLKSRFPDVKVIVGADGSKSLVRKQIFNDELVADYNVSYLVEVKYKITGTARKLSKTALFAAIARSEYYFTEEISKQINGESTVSLRLIVDEATYNALPNINFKNPGLIDDEMQNKSPQLYTTIKNWLRARGNESYIDGHELKLNKIKLDVYQARDVVKNVEDGPSWALVGDAAFGLPFFRSLNSGLLNGSQLALNIHKYLKAEEPDLNNYAYFFQRLADIEKSKVGVKNLLLGTAIRQVYNCQWAYSRGRTVLNGLLSLVGSPNIDEPNHEISNSNYTMQRIIA